MGAETIRRAAAVHPIVDLQIEYSLVSRGPESDDLPDPRRARHRDDRLRRPVARPARRQQAAGARDFRAHLPRFSRRERREEPALVDALARLAADRGVKPAQLAIAWVRAKAARRSSRPSAPARASSSTDALAALDIALSADEVAALEAAVPASAIAGTRYAEPQMKQLDSER